MDCLSNAIQPNVDRAPTALAIMWTWCALSAVFVGLRMFTRIKIVSRVGMDDYFMIVSLILALFFSSIYTISAKNGGSRHIDYLSVSQRDTVAKLNWIAHPFSVISIVSGKISVAISLLRMLVKVQRWQRSVLYFVIISVTGLGSVMCIVNFAYCSPPRALRTPSMDTKAVCWEPSATVIFTICANAYFAFTDFVMSILPFTILWNLQLKPTEKFELCIHVGLGILASFCATYKITKIPGAAHADFTWNTASLFIWMMNEIGAVIVAASIPTIQPFVTTYWEMASQSIKKRSLSNDTIEILCTESTSVPKHNEPHTAGALLSEEMLLPERVFRVSRRFNVKFTSA